MLVLSRRKDETIMIGDDIEITIVDVRGDTVRLGIQAPRSVSVHRKEIYNAIQAENIAAAQESVPDDSAVGGLGQLLKDSEPAGGIPSSAFGKLAGSIKPVSISGLAGIGLGPPKSQSAARKQAARKRDDQRQP